MDLDYIFWYNNLAKLIVTGLLPFVSLCVFNFKASPWIRTEIRYKAGPRLRDLASWIPLAAGVTSRNLGPTLERSSVVMNSLIGPAIPLPMIIKQPNEGHELNRHFKLVNAFDRYTER